MLRCIAYDESMRENWDRLALSCGTVFHTTAFRRILLDSFGYRCAYHALVDEHGTICALLPLVVCRNLGLKSVGASLPFVNHLDICADGEAAREAALFAMLNLQKEQNLKSVELRLKEQNVSLSGWQLYQHNVTFELPLLADETTTLAQASASCRNHVRKTYKNDWFAVSFDPGNLPAFYQVYVRRMKQLGSPAPAQSFFANFFQHLPDATTLLSVLDKGTGRVIGGMLLLENPSNSTLYYPYGANLVEYNHQYLNNFMYWEAVRFGIARGLKRLDIGRSPIDSGTYKFKLQWGAQPVQLNYLFHTDNGRPMGPPDRERLKGAIELWKVLPSWVTDRLGRAFIKYLMP